MDSNDQTDEVWLLGIQRKLYQWRKKLSPWFLESRVHNERCTLGSVSGRWKPAAAMPSGASARLYFGVSLFCSRHTGCSWLWINSRGRTPRALPTGASLALACMLVMWMVLPCVECSIALSLLWVLRSTSALTMILYSPTINGQLTFAFWMSTKSKIFPIRPVRIPSLSASSVPLGVIILIKHYFGTPMIWRESSRIIKLITIFIAPIDHLPVIRRLKLLAS